MSSVEVHIQDSVFLRDPSDLYIRNENDKNIVQSLLRLLLPGGNFVFKMRNVTFAGEGQAAGEGIIMAPHHCGFYTQEEMDGDKDGMATLCNVDYVLEDIDFTSVRGTGKWVSFLGILDGNPMAPVYTSQDGSLGENFLLLSNLYNGFEQIDECYLTDDSRFNGSIACDNEQVQIGRLIIWTTAS